MVFDALTQIFLPHYFLGLAVDGLSGGGGAVNNMMRELLIKIFTLPGFRNYFSHISMKLIHESFDYFQINNGQFFGQFVGKLISSLSAVIFLHFFFLRKNIHIH